MNENFTGGTLLRVFVGETDLLDGLPIFERVLELALKEGLMGATVLRGIESFGHKRETHTARILRLSEDLPVVVEIVDDSSKIEGLVKTIDSIFEKAGCGGLMTIEKVSMRRYEDVSN